MYKYIDRSADTAKSAYAPRRRHRRGVVLHETIGTESLAWLQRHDPNPATRSSSDFLISRVGDIYQIVPTGTYSFHSGPARWRLYQDPDGTLNESFIGVELENHPAKGQVITGAQYMALGALVRRLFGYHHMDVRNLCGHYECARPAGRKQDPTTLNWGMLSAELINPSSEQLLYRFPEVLP